MPGWPGPDEAVPAHAGDGESPDGTEAVVRSLEPTQSWGMAPRVVIPWVSKSIISAATSKSASAS